MKSYIATKTVQATPRFNSLGNEGYLVIYGNGYESWLPKESFERCYREITEKEKSLV